MSKSTKLADTKPKPFGRTIPFVMLVGFIGLGLIGYVVSQLFLPVEAHAAPWLIAVISAALGGVLGWLWYHWRGDII